MINIINLYKKTRKYVFHRDDFYHTEAALSGVIPYLLPRVPVFIIENDLFSALFDENQKTYDDNFPTEYLGVYCKDFDLTVLSTKFPDIPNVKCNCIFLCVNRIIDAADKLYHSDSRYNKGHLLTKVLIHEFGHAYMDLMSLGIKKSDPYYPYYRGNEESWANVFTLVTVENYLSKAGLYNKTKGGANDLMEIVIDFIKNHQPTDYSLGWFLWYCGINEYDCWAYNKHKGLEWTTWNKLAMTEFSKNSKLVPIPATVILNMKTMWESTKKEM